MKPLARAVVLAAFVSLTTSAPLFAQQAVPPPQPAKTASAASGWDVVIYPVLGWLPVFGANVRLPEILNPPPCDGCGDGGSLIPEGSTSSSLNMAAFAKIRLEKGRLALASDFNWAALSGSRDRAARIGGNAQLLFEAQNSQELAEIIQVCWDNGMNFTLIGGGSNLLVSDAGIHGLVILNRAREVQFREDKTPPQVWAESGANLGVMARMAAQRGLGGLEWAVGIPGTLGGAIFGNAGAHGSDISANLPVLAEILHRPENGKMFKAKIEEWTAERFRYEYRSSTLKRHPGEDAILCAVLKLERSLPELVQAKTDEYTAYRRRTQPPGASLGSMFKNPPEDFAGRLIEAAGLKGLRIVFAFWATTSSVANH